MCIVGNILAKQIHVTLYIIHVVLYEHGTGTLFWNNTNANDDWNMICYKGRTKRPEAKSSRLISQSVYFGANWLRTVDGN